MGLLKRRQRKSKKSRQAGDLAVERGLKALDKDDLDFAVQEFELAVEKGCKGYAPALVYTMLGKAYKQNKRLSDSIIAHEKALELDPDMARAWNNLGNTYYAMGDLERSEECSLKAINLDTTYVYAYGSLGAVHIRRNENEKASARLEQAVDLGTDVPVIYGNLAMAYAGMGDFTAARETLDRAILLGYTNWEVVDERIKALAAGSAREKERLNRLPAHCPFCNAPVRMDTIDWQSQTVAVCMYCGSRLNMNQA